MGDKKQPPDALYRFVGDVDPQRIWVWKPVASGSSRAQLDGWKHFYPLYERITAATWKAVHGVEPAQRDGYIFISSLDPDSNVYVIPPWVTADHDRPNVLYLAGDLLSLAEFETRTRAAAHKAGSSTPWGLIALAALGLWYVTR